MEKIKKHKEIIIIAAIILVLAFYWFQLRPTIIKKNCSWVTPSGASDLTYEAYAKSQGIPFTLFVELDKRNRGFKFTRKATKSEYDACLRENGL